MWTLEGHRYSVSSVAFLPDGNYLASASHDRTVMIWEAATGQCIRTINVGTTLSSISFDLTAYLLTEIGYIDVLADVPEPTDAAASPALSIDSQQPEGQRRLGYGFSSDRFWITFNGQNVLWLPSEYRPSCSAVLRQTVGVGCRSGRVLIIGFSPA